MQQQNKSQFHFFASSVAEWMTTTDTRTLPDVVAIMDKAGYSYSLWMVPGHWTTEYEIKSYAPQIEGCTLLGNFKTPGERKAEAKRLEQEANKALDEEVWGKRQQPQAN